MKKLLILPVVLAVVSCGTKNENTPVTELIHKRDSLKEIYKTISGQLRELDDQIALMDTSNKHRAVKVVTEQLVYKKFEHFFEVQGTVETDKNVTINPEFGGSVQKINVEVGQSVTQGTALVIIDTEVIRKNIDEVKTALELALNMFQKQEKLWNQKIGSELQYLEAKNRKESLEKKIVSLKAQMEKAIITAPFDGVVDEVFVKEGEAANPMFPLLRLVNIRDIYMVADVSEEYLGKVKPNTYAMVEFSSLDVSFKAKVSRMGQNINPNNRTFKIQVDLTNEDGLLKPNLLGVINIRDVEIDSAISVPANIIQQDALGKEFVYIVDQGNSVAKAKKVLIESGITYKNITHIKSGLAGNEAIILKGARGIKDGQIIEI